MLAYFLKTLLYTIAFDSPNENKHQMMARMLVSSVVRTGFEGDIKVFTNAPEYLRDLESKSVEVICICSSKESGGIHIRRSKSFKFEARHHFDASEYRSVLYVDCDCLFFDNPLLLESPISKLLYSTEPYARIGDDMHGGYLSKEELGVNRPAISSGILMTSGSDFSSVMEQWEAVYNRPAVRPHSCVDQSAWIRVVLDNSRVANPFAACPRIKYPLLEKTTSLDIERGVVLHFAGGNAAAKLAHMAANYIRRFCPDIIQGMLKDITTS